MKLIIHRRATAQCLRLPGGRLLFAGVSESDCMFRGVNTIVCELVSRVVTKPVVQVVETFASL